MTSAGVEERALRARFEAEDWMRDVIELLFEVVFEVLVEVFELEGLEGLEGSGLVFAPLEVLDGGFSLLDIIPGLGSVRQC